MVKKKKAMDDMKDMKKTGKKNTSCNMNGCGCGGAGYMLGFIGSAIYYISTASGFWVGVLGVLKSLVWPAFLVFELLKLVGA
jgi:hypothetical protein